MVFGGVAPTSGAPFNLVQFYVYGVDTADENDGSLIPPVALDSEGPKAVPGLCLSCHSRDYDAGGHFANLSWRFGTPEQRLQKFGHRSSNVRQLLIR